jgi:hypothetical protein
VNDEQSKFLGELCARFPFAARLRDQSVKDNGEESPFLVMADVTRQVVAWHNEESATARHQVRDVCAYLEEQFGRGSAAVQELISF